MVNGEHLCGTVIILDVAALFKRFWSRDVSRPKSANTSWGHFEKLQAILNVA